jgi:putative DNA primase/helicase
MRGVPRVPYRLPEVLAAVAAGDRIYICEGEKDAERANAAGLVATTNPGGAGKWRPEYAEFLRGADVTIVRDRDEKGRHHADEVAKSLEGVARSVQIVEAKAGKDLSDHLGAGLTVEELVDVTSESPVGAVREEPDSSAEHLTDLGNARRFCALHGREVRYSHPERSWYVWDGRRWQRDETAGIERLAKEVPGAIYQEAAAADPEEREALAKWALRSESRDRIRAMLDLAASEPGIPVHPGDFDRDPDVLNLLNGTLALRTQQLRPHRREDLLTKLSPVEWNPDAHSELWERFQEKALPDPSARRFAQKAAGATLLGRSGADVVILIHGPTRTGKGTKQNAISSALGDYAVTAGLEDFAERDRAGGARPELVRLRGARMVSVYETSRRLKLSASLVKTLSGSDPLTVRDLYSRPATYLPQFTLWIATNYRPRIPEDDDALWERLREIPFSVQIPEGERDPRVRAELSNPKASGAAILAWAVQGCRLFLEEGLVAPEIVRSATRNYRSEMNPLAGFAEERLVFGEAFSVRAADLREEYEAWARKEALPAVGGKRMGAALRAMGCIPERNNTGRFWIGVGLRDQGA